MSLCEFVIDYIDQFDLESMDDIGLKYHDDELCAFQLSTFCKCELLFPLMMLNLDNVEFRMDSNRNIIVDIKKQRKIEIKEWSSEYVLSSIKFRPNWENTFGLTELSIWDVKKQSVNFINLDEHYNRHSSSLSKIFNDEFDAFAPAVVEMFIGMMRDCHQLYLKDIK